MAMRRPHLARMFRCAGASVAGVAVEFALLTLLVSVFHVFYLVGALIAGAAYFVINFVINRRWAFRSKTPDVWPQLFRHSLVTGGGMLLGTPLLWLLVEGIGLPYQIGWAATGAIAFFIWTFPMHRRFTYRMAVA